MVWRCSCQIIRQKSTRVFLKGPGGEHSKCWYMQCFSYWGIVNNLCSTANNEWIDIGNACRVTISNTYCTSTLAKLYKEKLLFFKYLNGTEPCFYCQYNCTSIISIIINHYNYCDSVHSDMEDPQFDIRFVISILHQLTLRSNELARVSITLKEENKIMGGNVCKN